MTDEEKLYTEKAVLDILEKNRIEYMNYCFNMSKKITELLERVEKLEKEKATVLVIFHKETEE